MRFPRVVLALTCVAVAPPAAAVAAPRPDLQVRAVSSPSPQEAPLSRMLASATVRNAGDATAPASRLGFYLSRDRRKSGGDFRLRPRARVRARRPGARTRLLRTLTLPGGIPTGRFVLIACADDTNRIRERSERNNCRSARRTIRIVERSVPTLPRLPVIVPGPTGPGTVFLAPSLVVTGPPNGSVTLDTTPSYTGTAASAGSTVARIEVSVGSGPFSAAGVTCSGCGTRTASFTFIAPPLAEGAHSFGFRALDAAGQSSPTVTRTLAVDTSPPTFNAIAATAGSTSVTATFSEPLACGTVGASDFQAVVGAVSVAVKDVSCAPTSATITLTLASAPGSGAGVSVTLLGVVSDPAGNVAPRPTIRSDSA